MAHSLHRMMREAFISEKSLKESKKSSSGDGGAAYNKLMAQMGM
jgi:hypothetical protein